MAASFLSAHTCLKTGGNESQKLLGKRFDPISRELYAIGKILLEKDILLWADPSTMTSRAQLKSKYIKQTMKIKNQSRPIGKKQYKHACLAIAVGAMILPGAATAATVFITNHSFQDPVVLAETNREQTVGYIPGWTITRVAGTSTGGGHVSGVNVSGTLFGNPLTAPFDDTQFYWANLRNDGPTIAVAHLDSLSLGNLAANTVYTLNVATAARRTDFRSEITIGLLAGGVEVGTFTSTITAINTPSEVTTYTLDTLAAPTGVGDDMQIRIRMSTPVADADGFAQVAIDNVRLDATVIPEPSTALLGGLGMLALLRRRRS